MRSRPRIAAAWAAVVAAGVMTGCGSLGSPPRSGAAAPATVATKPASVPVAQLVALARQSLHGLGNRSVAFASAVATTKQAAENWIVPGSVPPDPSGPRAYLILIHGRFVCMPCSRPPGASTPHGRSIEVVWVPGQGVTDWGLAPSVRTGLGRLGRVVKIKLGRPLLVHVVPRPPPRLHPVAPARVVPTAPSQVRPLTPARVLPTAPSQARPLTPSHLPPMPSPARLERPVS